MFKLRSVKEQSSFVKILKDILISVLTEYSLPFCSACKTAFAVNKLQERKVIISANLRVVLTKRRSNMNYTCSVCKSYIMVTCYIICFLAKVILRIQSDIFLIFKILSCIFFNILNLCILAKVRLYKLLCKNEILVT